MPIVTRAILGGLSFGLAKSSTTQVMRIHFEQAAISAKTCMEKTKSRVVCGSSSSRCLQKTKTYKDTTSQRNTKELYETNITHSWTWWM
jgi:hypothetical protein